MELVIDVMIQIRNQTKVMHKTEDAKISHAEDMKDVKREEETRESADQINAHPVKKTWNLTSLLVAEIDSKVNVSNATPMKRTDEFL
jgi:carbonic anhydrase